MSVANRPVHRPLSPHLQVYKPQLTSVLSILHRATGIALSVGALCGAMWGINRRPNALAAASEADLQLRTADLLATAWMLRTSSAQSNDDLCVRQLRAPDRGG